MERCEGKTVSSDALALAWGETFACCCCVEKHHFGGIDCVRKKNDDPHHIDPRHGKVQFER